MWRNLRVHTRDAQQFALSFLQQQLTIIEPQVYRIQYPDVQYPDLVPIDTSGPEWVKSITYRSSDAVGRAQWFHEQAMDIPVADIAMDQFEQVIEMAAIGYRYNTPEVMQAAQAGVPLTAEKAIAVKRIYEEFVDDVALRGNADKAWKGLINQTTGITAVNVPADGTGSSPYWKDKTTAQVMRDFNSALSGMYLSTLTMDIADTILIPLGVWTFMSETQIANTTMTLLSWIMQNNLYTARTRQPLTIVAVRGLETAGDSNTGRLVAYRKDPSVIKLHIPMPHKFFPVTQRSTFVYEVPGVFRLGGVEIRRPTAFRYLDHISPTP